MTASETTGACETPMADHVDRFWQILETEYVRVLVDMKRHAGSVPYWDSSSFPDDVAKALVAERKRLTAALSDQPKEPIAWQNIDRIIDALEAAGCCRNEQVISPEDHVANTIRNWLRSLYAASPPCSTAGEVG